MRATWLSAETDFAHVILAGDVGGTNTTLALFGMTDRRFTMLFKASFASQEVRSFLDPVAETLRAVAERGERLKPRMCCVCAAGPVRDNVCRMTNTAWDVDGQAIERRFGIRTVVVNDFAGLSFGLPLLDLENPAQITKLPHSDGTFAPPSGERLAVLGAGTGLGLAFLIESDGRSVAVPSEGGHSDFAPVDEESAELWRFVMEQYGGPPGAEPFVSGRGINNIFEFFKRRGMPVAGILAEIDAASSDERPALISAHAQDSPDCKRIMRRFVGLYGSFAARAALMFLPTGGLFIAGGIVEKNEPLFVEDHLFMKAFEYNYKDNIRAVLMGIPVFIVRDYATSLYGAANAASSLLRRPA